MEVNKIIDEFAPPDGYELITKGLIKEGDIILSAFLGYVGWDTIVTKEMNGYYHYLGYDLKGVDVEHFKGVARKLTHLAFE